MADVSGRSVLLTRYLRRLRPPEQLLSSRSSALGGGGDDDDDDGGQAAAGSDSVLARIAWFVSLVPYASKRAMFPGLQEIWMASQDFLAVMCGAESEHAVLLANYLSGIGRTAYLVLGQVSGGSLSMITPISTQRIPLELEKKLGRSSGDPQGILYSVTPARSSTLMPVSH